MGTLAAGQVVLVHFPFSDLTASKLRPAVVEVGAIHYGADRQQSGEEKTQHTVREELRRRCWKEEDLPGLPKGDKSKVALARRLRQETTMSLKWIARRLRMGSWTDVSNVLHNK
jgi:hypothetical protein